MFILIILLLGRNIRGKKFIIHNIFFVDNFVLIFLFFLFRQRYEAASTIYGPHTLRAYMQQYAILTEKILNVSVLCISIFFLQ